MTPYDHMRKHLQKVAGGGIAWEWGIFTSAKTLPANALLDAAVDIAWERLMPNTLEHPPLDIQRRGNLIVFRLLHFDLHQAFMAKAA